MSGIGGAKGSSLLMIIHSLACLLFLSSVKPSGKINPNNPTPCQLDIQSHIKT